MPKFGTRLLAAIAAVVAAVLVTVGVTTGIAADTANDTPPQVAKTLVSNNDGTYRLTLSVTGTASTSSESSKANVVIVFDTSGSMDYSTGQYTYTPTDEKYGTYGLVDGEYVELDYHRARRGRAEYWTYGWYDTRYEGTRYTRTGGTRLQVAQDATTKLIDQLTANNTDTNPYAVEISLVNFATNVKGTTDWTTDAATLDTAVNGYTAEGGTNWEAALAKAKELADAKHEAQPDEETYIIFVSDGNPTFRDSKYSRWANDNRYYYSEGVWGTGNSDPNDWNFGAAKDVVNSLDSSYHLYTIGAFGDADTMRNLGGTYYDASDEAALNAAFKNILNEITNAVGYNKVKVTDNVTSLTANLIDTDAAGNFTYTKGGEEWTDVPEGAKATFTDGKVSWDLSSLGALEQGVTYTVSFDVWPSQEAMDILADLKNGTKKYDDLTADQKAQIVKSSDGYALRTNTADGNTVTYNKVETTTSTKLPDGVTQNEDGTWTAPDGSKWTQNEDGTYTGTKETPGQVDFTNPDPMPLTSSDMTLKKKFENDLDSYAVDSVDLTVTSDGKTFLEKKLTSDSTPAWTSNISIAPGIIKTTGDTYEVLESGHDYTVTEPASEYHYDLSVATYHPMIIDGTLTMLKQDDAGQYTINGKKYAKVEGAAAATITATNYRRSTINLTKTVESKTAGVTAPDKAFSFSGTVTDPTGADVWFSVEDAEGKLVQNLTTSATAEVKDGAKTGYYYVGSGTEFTVSLKAGQNLRIINAPKGMKYSFTENSDDMPEGFTFNKATGTNGATVSGKTVSGEVTQSNTTYAVSFKNDYTSKSTTASIPVKKNLTVPEGLTAPNITGKYTFTLTADDGTPMPATTALTNPDEDGGTVSFGDIAYDKPGTYTYTVTETGEVKGVSNDSVSAKTVTVVVADNGEGQLVATVNGGKDLEFTNAYSVGETTATIPVEKVLSIPSGLTGPGDITGKYTFKLEAEDNAPMPAEKTEIKNPAANGGTASFGTITYTKPGTYKYKVTETGSVDGVTNDAQATKEITVVVKDNSDGTMTATVNGGVAVKFTNTYSATAATINLGASKTLSAADGLNAPDVTGKYDLTIAAVTEGAPMPKTTSAKNPDGQGTAVSFGDITFTKEGDYTYTVSESGSVEGVTNDAHTSKEVTVHVADDGKGALKATVTSGDRVTNFTNTYTVKPAEIDTSTTVLLTKKVVAEGTAWAGENGKTFNFTITPKDGAPAPMADGTAVTTGSATFKQAGEQTISFGTITFTAPGEYKYELNEDTTNLGDGWKCTGSPKTVTVKVTDDGKGNLTAALEGDAATITNTYTTTPAELDSSTTAVFTKKAESSLTLTKSAEFTFTIAPVNGAPAPTKSEGSVTFDATGQKTVDFGTFTFKQAGDYEYTVTEGTLPAGWTASSTTATIKIHVADNGQGQLVATVTQVGEITNTYGVKPVTADPPVTKVIEGDVPADKMPTFEFTLTPDDAANPMPAESSNGSKTVTINGAGSTEFGEISFAKPGTYTYTVTETKGGGTGWTNDRSAYTIKYEVTDKGDGTLGVARTITKNGQTVESDTFTNTYASTGKLDTAATAVLTKTVKNSIDNADANWKSKTFEFTIAPATGNPADVTIENSNGTATFTQAGTQTISFGNITFTKAGTYNFTLTETTQSGDGWTCDNTPKNVEVKVTDNGEGKLTAKVTKAAEITNTYGDKPLQDDTAVKLSVKKSLTGATLAAGQFSFELKDARGNVLQTKSNAADGTVSFEGLEYTKPGVYKYTISEKDEGKKGYTYDSGTSEVTVTVTDKGNGTMSTSVAYTKQTFSNKYEASGTTGTTIYAQKNLTGRTLEADQFSFQLKDSDGNVLQTKKNDASGRVIFDAIKYDQSIFDDAATTTTSAKADAVVTDEETEVPTEAADTKAAEVTTEATDTTTDEAADEKTDVDAATATDETDADVVATEAATDAAPVTEVVDEEPVAEAPAKVPAKEPAADAETTARTKTFTYTISEVADNKAGYTYDTHVETVTVKVTDKGDGELTVTTTYDEDGAVFDNSYKASGETGDSITATKTLTGRDMTEGEFAFALLDAAGNEVATGKNAADGTVVFSSIKYDQTQVGEHTYTMVEKGGSATGVTYDTIKLPVTVKVTDNGDGTLATAVSYPKGHAFKNVYKPLSGSGYLTAQKVLEGRELAAGEFSFELLDASGKVIDTRTNAADGAVTFDNLSFDEAGTYTYQVREVQGNESGVTYDTKTATYTVKVEDKDGQLTVTSVTADGSDKAPVFTNVYTPGEPDEPVKPDKPSKPSTPARVIKSLIPQTGDPFTSVAEIAVTGAACVALAHALRRRKASK